MLRSLRLRIAIGASLVMAVILTVAALSMHVVQERRLVASVDSTLDKSLDDIALAVDLVNDEDSDEAEVLQTVLGVVLAGSSVQVVDHSGDVVSSNVAGGVEAPLVELPDDLGRHVTVSLEGEKLRATSRKFDVPTGTLTLIVARSLREVDESVASVDRIFAAGVPVLVLFLGWLTWLVAGRALRPVDEIRRDVDEISASDPDRRVTVPDSAVELERLAVTMNRMLDRLSESADRQARFVSDASHELRSPLASIRTQIEVDLAHPDEVDWQASEREVLHETVRMQNLVEALLAVARGEATESADRTRPVDLDDLIMEEARRLELPSGTELDLSGVSAAQVSGDPDELRRAAANLLTNAVRHAASHIWVTLIEHPRGVELTVADDGPGVPPEARDLIFERFTRLDDSRARDSGGSGLGLSIVKAIVTAHGGRVYLDPTFEDGARFVVELPLPSDGSTGPLGTDAPWEASPEG